MQNDLRVHSRTDQGPDSPSDSSPGQFELSEPAHFLSAEDVVSLLRTDAELGLSDNDAHARLSQVGPNEISGEGGVSPLRILMKQIFNAMVLVLILAMAVTFAIKSWIEAGVVTAVVIVNIVVGFFQEYSAEKTMNSLRALSSPTANAVRGGVTNNIRSADLVPGDLVEVKMGDTIPADLRLVEAMIHFETDEALLTGESLPVAKKTDPLAKQKEGDDDIGVGDRINMAYSSSTVTRGRAKGVVVSTGMKTEIGRIAESLQGKSSRVRTPKQDEKGNTRKRDYAEAAALTVWDQFGKFLGTNGGTPLQQKLSWLAIILFGIAVVFAIVCMAANKFSDRPDVILYAVGTGLSMIPASLVVVLTITMAVGTKVMAKRNVIVRKLDSLEALGAVTNICSDKTGTLTQGKMVVKKAWVIAEGSYSVGDIQNPVDPTASEISFTTRSPYEDKKIPKTQAQVKAETEWKHPAHFYEDNEREILRHYLDTATFCNIATVDKNKETNEWQARGDPTEIAIQVFASRFGHGRKKFTHGEKPTWTQLAEYPFDSDVKRMAVVFRKHAPGEPDDWIFMKGAVERVIESCSKMHTGEGEVEFTKEHQANVIKNMESLASEGLRVLALAHRPASKISHEWDDVDRGEVERDMCLLGLIGLYDPPRLETAAAVKACHRAGINVHMVTGDHPQTAKAIAIEVGIVPKSTHMLAPDVVSSMVMTASQFDRLSEQEIDDLPVLPLVIARCAPQTKVRMVDALHRRGKFVAMTGDGVNDSPALKRADVGIGMGMSGSDVAKDASDIVLTDDNFASILNSIEEGRRMFDNIKKFVLHLLAENIAQACTLLIGLAFKDKTGLSTFPLAPVEILWIIMITSGFPAMGLGLEKASADVMTRPPHNRRVGIFTKEVLIDLTVYGFWMAALCLCSFSLVVWGFGDGQLGHDCNNTYSPTCELVFRARSTTFVCLTWFALVLAWEMVHMRRSFFRMEPKPDKPYTIWAHHIWGNRFLFWSIFAGFITVFPILYIPVINTKVFKHAPISWEWGIVFVEAVLFIMGVELWKLGKRVYFRKYGDKVANPEAELAGQTFSRYTSTRTEASANGTDASTLV